MYIIIVFSEVVQNEPNNRPIVFSNRLRNLNRNRIVNNHNRNTNNHNRIININRENLLIAEREEFECNIDVYDYWIDKSDLESKNLNFINELPLDSKKYDAIVVAVGHKKFKDITTQMYESMSNKKPIIIDVKGIVENPTWRL